MKKKIFISALFAALTGFSGSAMAADGAAIYKSKCAVCHGTDGKGTVMGAPLAGSSFMASSSDQTIADVILRGREGDAKMYKNIALGMPAQQLNDEDVSAVILYMKSLAAQ